MFLLVSGRHPDGRQHGVSIKISINLAEKILRISCVRPSFKNTASIFPEISFIQYFLPFSCKQWRHHWSNLHNRKTSISLKRKKIFQKEKRHSSVFWKAFRISRNYFSCHIHFKWNDLGEQDVIGEGSFGAVFITKTRNKDGKSKQGLTRNHPLLKISAFKDSPF